MKSLNANLPPPQVCQVLVLSPAVLYRFRFVVFWDVTNPSIWKETPLHTTTPNSWWLDLCFDFQVWSCLRLPWEWRVWPGFRSSGHTFSTTSPVLSNHSCWADPRALVYSLSGRIGIGIIWIISFFCLSFVFFLDVVLCSLCTFDYINVCAHMHKHEKQKESDFAWKNFMKVHTSHWHVLVSFFGFYFVGVRCTFVIIKPVAPSQFNSGTCQVPGGGHGVSDRVNMLVKPSNSKWNQQKPWKEASKGWVWINTGYLLWHMVKTKKRHKSWSIANETLVNRFDRIKKKPSLEFFPWSECITPCVVCWCLPSSNPSASQIRHFFLGNSWKVLVLQRVLVQHRRIKIVEIIWALDQILGTCRWTCHCLWSGASSSLCATSFFGLNLRGLWIWHSNQIFLEWPEIEVQAQPVAPVQPQAVAQPTPAPAAWEPGIDCWSHHWQFVPSTRGHNSTGDTKWYSLPGGIDGSWEVEEVHGNLALKFGGRLGIACFFKSSWNLQICKSFIHT